MIKYQIGDSWRGLDLCQVYTCDLREGEAERSLTETRCETECGEGEVFSPSSTQCCGRCVPSHCLLQDGTKLEAGQSVEAAGSACNTSVRCSIVNGAAVIEKSSQSCPTLPADCPPASVRLQGCCEVCLRCSSGNITRNIGDYWKADSCTTCTCRGESYITANISPTSLLFRGRSSGLHQERLPPPCPRTVLLSSSPQTALAVVRGATAQRNLVRIRH